MRSWTFQLFSFQNQCVKFLLLLFGIFPSFEMFKDPIQGNRFEISFRNLQFLQSFVINAWHIQADTQS